jgi:hypothetical protein
MKRRVQVLWIIMVIAAISLLLEACGPSQSDLLLGRWEPSDGGKYGYLFREFTSDEPREIRTLPSGVEQDGVVIIIVGDAGAAATYTLSEKGELRINIRTATMTTGYIFQIESISSEKLVLRDSTGQSLQFDRVIEYE